MHHLTPAKQLSILFFVTLVISGFDGNYKLSWAMNHGQVSGRLLTASGPLSTGTLAFFHAEQGSNPADRTILRIPERTAIVDKQGRFAVAIQYGRYLLGYFPGQQKNSPGLPENNFKAFLAGKSESEPYILHIKSPHYDAGDITFYPVTKTTADQSFTVSGVVRNKSGKPIGDISIIAKKDLNSFRPQYISMPTDSSGKYTFILPPGDYYLLARHRLRKFGRPLTGEYFGIWGIDEPAGEFGWFPTKKGQSIIMHAQDGQTVYNVDITVFKIPDPTTQEEILRAGGSENAAQQ